MKVLVLIPTRSHVESLCLQSVQKQDCADYSILVHILKPIKLHGDSEKDRVLNIVRNRNMMREIALKSDSDWFLWVDSDTIIPPHTISTFLKYQKPFMGGWYKKKDGSRWVAGKILHNGLFHFFEDIPLDNELPVDLLGLGCAFMHRSVLEQVEFNGGVDRSMTDTSGKTYFFAECAMFCDSSKKIGVTPTLIHDVVCGHLPVLT